MAPLRPIERCDLEDAVPSATDRPTALARVILRSLDGQLDPDRAIPIEAIAAALDILAIEDKPLVGLVGTLVTDAYRIAGAIAVQQGMRPGRRRYTIAHELAHFLFWWHRSSNEAGFACNGADMRATGSGTPFTNGRERPIDPVAARHRQQEAEANRFAIELLAPAERLRTHLVRDADLRHALAIADRCDISKLAAARRACDLTT